MAIKVLGSSNRLWRLIPLVVGVEATLIVGSHAIERGRLKWDEKSVRYNGEVVNGPQWLKYETPGLIRPPVSSASLATLPDDEVVIGISMGEAFRAYRLELLKDKSTHLINDVVGGVPVSVAYCDLNDCVRAYGPRLDTPTGDPVPLPIELEGLLDGAMVLKVGGVLYFQETGKAVAPTPDSPGFPFADLAWTRTTWGAWKRLHPDTEVYERLP